MALKVAICDDDQAVAVDLRAKTTAWLTANGHQAEVSVFGSGEDLLKANQQWDILLIDIFMPGHSGIESVRAMGAKMPKALVFITSSRDYAVEAFALHAVHYLVKPVAIKALGEALSRCMAQMDTNDAVLEIHNGRGVLPVIVSSIQYAEIQNKLLVLHTDHEDVETYMTLDTLVSQLPSERFVKAQRSFVVNLDYVQSCLYDRLILRNGTEVMLSRTNRTELKAQYQQYLFRKARRCSG